MACASSLREWYELSSSLCRRKGRIKYTLKFSGEVGEEDNDGSNFLISFCTFRGKKKKRQRLKMDFCFAKSSMS